MRSLWRHVEYNYREGGVRQITNKIFWRLTQWLWSESVWLIYRLELADYRTEVRLSLRRSPLEFETLVRLGYFKAAMFPEMMHARLASGAVCHGFFVGDELANIAWTTSGYLELEPGLSIPAENSVGVYDCFTLPAHRSKGVYTDTLMLLACYIRELGAKTAFIAVDPVNRHSIKGIERAGFRPLYRLKRLRRWGRQSFEKSTFACYPGL